MNWLRVLTVAFWTFVAVMLAWQFYNYNNSLVANSEAHPPPHFFYNPAAVAAKPAGPDLHQTDYQVMPGTPEPGSFTVEFAVKNQGGLTATGIQVHVRPYRGIIKGNQDEGVRGSASGAPISDDDPLSQFGQWVTLPDLAPGQSTTNSVVFADQPGEIPADHLKLDITFSPAKAQ